MEGTGAITDELASVLAQLPVPLCILREPDLVYELANEAYLGACGRRDLVGLRFVEALPEVAVQGVEKVLREVLSAGQPGAAREVLVEFAGGAGRSRYRIFMASPLDRADGVGRVMMIGAEAPGPAMARRRAARFGEIAAGIVGHDLRNPLSAIAAGASLLERRAPDSERITTPVGRIQRSVARLERMIARLEDLALLTQGRALPLDPWPADLAEVCRQLVAEAEASGLPAFHFELAGDPRGTWDRNRLSQLVVGLTGGIGARGSAGSAVRVSLDGTAPDVVRLEVAHSGVVPAQRLAHLLEPPDDFSEVAREHAGSTRDGLGLCLAFEIAAAHHGSIRVESEPERGTRFFVELERHLPELDDDGRMRAGLPARAAPSKE